MLPCVEGPGCRVVATCTFSGLRAVLELPQSTCCCRRSDTDTETHFWSVSSSTESLHEAGCSSLPELNQGLGKVVREVLSQLHHVMIDLNNPLAIREIATKIMTTGSLQSLTPSPGMETMRRVSSSPILSQDSSSVWSHQGPNEHLKREESAVSLQEFPSIPSTEISPIKGSTTKSVPSFRTSSPRSIQSSLEKLSIRSNSNIIEKLEGIHKELGNILSLARGNSSSVMDKTRQLHAVNNSAPNSTPNSTPKSTPKSTRKPPASRLVPSSVPRPQQKRMLQAPQTLPRDRKIMIKTQSTVKKFFSGSKLKTAQTDPSGIASKATPVVARRRITPQTPAQNMDTKFKVDKKKLTK
ncbi:uncharacterized protein LOC126184256 [Schistocerca cancellata]|uniref:uncharacterized protein LOC126184256 n=1 Tax=Schistocerca cancellata TaxID=274614 RepID=UPI0021187EBB|nr:uncharacterized protein LOC126184256 [Schistocerca cancellata]